MNAKELRALTLDALRTKEEELARDIVTLRFHGVGKEKNIKRLKALRHERARALTVLWERQQAEGKRQKIENGRQQV